MLVDYNNYCSFCKTHVPLLNRLNISAQSLAVVAIRLATMFRSHSITAPVGSTNFQRAGLLLPMVVSSVTCRHKTHLKDRIKREREKKPQHLNKKVEVRSQFYRQFSPSRCLGCKSHLQKRWTQDMMKRPEFHQEEQNCLKNKTQIIEVSYFSFCFQTSMAT